jgi:hypothetical protein
MPEYKNIWFADNSEKMSVENISETQAISIGDALEDLKYNTSIICTDDIQVAEAFPGPKQGDRVYRADLGVEQMYFGVYSPTLNPYGKTIAGWYAVSSGLVPIYPQDVTSDGTTSATVNSSGKVTFTGATFISLGTIFSDEFRNYKVVFNQTESNGATATNFRYINNSNTELTGNLYYRNVLAAETASVAPASSAIALTNLVTVLGAPTFRIGHSEITFFGPRAGVHPRSLSNSASANLSTASRMEQATSFYNSTTEIMKGLIFRGNGTQRITGTIEVYGYR